MKVAFIFLMCFVTVTFQQNVYSRRSQAAKGFPNYYGITKFAHRYPAFHPYQEDDELPYYFRNHPEDGSNSDIEPAAKFYGDEYIAPKPKFFRYKWWRHTSTTYATSVSTIQVPTLVTCYTSTMFATSTACRRKRSLLDSISVEDIHDEGPTQHETVAVDPLPRQGRDMDTTRWIESSKQQYDSDSARWSNFGRRERQLLISLLNRIETSTVTSTITSYTLSYSSTTVTNTKLAGIQALSCLPSGYTLC